MHIPPRVLVLALVSWGLLGAPARALAEDSPERKPDDGKALVHMDGDWLVTLEQQDLDEWREVCDAPCDVRLPIDAKYRTHGRGIQASAPFSLAPRGGRAELHVIPVSDSNRSTAVTLMVAGAVMMPVGILVVLGVLFNADRWTDAATPLAIAGTGLVVLSAGFISLIAGGALASVGSTKVTQPLATPKVGARSPTWNMAVAQTPSATSFVVPIFSGTF